MNFSIQGLKKSLYIAETLFGVLLVIPAILTLRLAFASSDVLFYLIPGLALLVAAGACILLGVESVILRDDPDIWD
jgi:hypothetical protein